MNENRDAMRGMNIGIEWALNIQRAASPGPLITHADLIGNYRSGMMDYRESEGHKDWLKQQDAAFNSPTGLNSHREMSFGEPVVTPKTINIFVESDYQQRVNAGNEAFIKSRNEERSRRNEQIAQAWVSTTDHNLDNPLFVNQDKKGKHFGNGFGIQPINVDNDVLPSGGMHDSFKVNSSGDIFGGHTTIELKGFPKKVRMPWEMDLDQNTNFFGK